MFGETTYLDNSATTRLDERVLEAMKPYFFETYAVATSEFGYSLGIEAREALDAARGAVAQRIGAAGDEIVFTSGSTESSNMALKGVALALGEKKGRHIVTTAIEDFPVLNTARTLERQGFTVTYLPVDGDGRLDAEAVRAAITPETILVSVQHANQEIGTVQDVEAVGRIAREQGVVFHSDATHTFTRVPLDVRQGSPDLVTLSAHTIHGPRGVGALYVRPGTPLKKWMDGGFQERDLRAGVEDVPGAVGFAEAVRLVTAEETAALQAMRDRVIDRLLAEVPHVTLNGHRRRRTPHNANLTFHYVEGESITLQLDMRGFAVSTGSACFSKSLEASHVILGIGGDHERAHGSVRFTFGRFNTMEDADRVVESIAEVVERLRAISPLAPKD
ncbi:MAG: cysteine desulfurase [Actinobacteria bacterium]|nr:cysteine desulfurase [Actinomycetota bacterium]